MKQKINLYHEKFRPKKIPVSAFQVLVGWSVLLVLLIAFSGFELYRHYRLEGDIQALQQQLNRVLSKTQAMEEQIKQKKNHETRLEKENKKLLAKIQKHREILSYLSNQKNIASVAFSQYLIDLSKINNKNLSLDKIIINNDKHYLRLQGKARHQQNISDYIERISRYPAFASLRFRYIHIEKADQQQNLYLFDISTQRESAEQELLNSMTDHAGVGHGRK